MTNILFFLKLNLILYKYSFDINFIKNIIKLNKTRIIK